MFDGTSRSDAGLPALERARGRVRLRYGAHGLAVLHHGGALKVRFPRAQSPEAVLLNTAGGLAGGDRLACDIGVAGGGALTITTAACEKVYRAEHEPAVVDVALAAAPGARLDWLPQETILFDRSRLVRRLSVDLAADARLLVAEGLVFGRAARGEIVTRCVFHDSWRIRRDGILVFAEEARLEDEAAAPLAARAALGGNTAAATLLYVAPDAEQRLDRVRAALGHGDAGASVRDGVLLVRILARDGFALRPPLTAAIAALREAPLPKVWHC